jgi:hypothetical protein
MIIDPIDTSPNRPAPFNRLVETTAADPLAEAEAAKLPVAEGETSGVWGVMEFVGAGTLFKVAA